MRRLPPSGCVRGLLTPSSYFEGVTSFGYLSLDMDYFLSKIPYLCLLRSINFLIQGCPQLLLHDTAVAALSRCICFTGKIWIAGYFIDLDDSSMLISFGYQW